jgi:hypothetical protein
MFIDGVLLGYCHLDSLWRCLLTKRRIPDSEVVPIGYSKGNVWN